MLEIQAEAAWVNCPRCEQLERFRRYLKTKGRVRCVFARAFWIIKSQPCTCISTPGEGS